MKDFTETVEDMRDSILPILFPKPSDWKDDSKVVLCLLHPLFWKHPQMWKYALGIPLKGTPNVWMYTDIQFNTPSLNALKENLVNRFSQENSFSASAGFDKGAR
jgi:hypothetical protein